MQETTREKVERILSRDLLLKLKQAGVRIVDDQDYQTMEEQYNNAWSENKLLKLKISKLEAQLKKGEAK